MKTLKNIEGKLSGGTAIKIRALASFLVVFAILTGFGCSKKNTQIILPPEDKTVPSDNRNNNNTNTGELDKGPFTTKQVLVTATDPAITYKDSVHVVKYNPKIENNKIVLWLTGTTGLATSISSQFFTVLLERKYRLISLSYITVPSGVDQTVCGGGNLYPTCYQDFRQVRAYGDMTLSNLPDQPQDAIIPRFVKLLQYLKTNDPQGKWENYLDGDKPRWDKICIAGQSQGGGMGLFIAKKQKVYKVISFSGGWDVKAPKTIADWYYWPSATPAANLYGVYHVQEAMASTLAQLYPACGIPDNQIYRLSKVLRPNVNPAASNPYHGEGIGNPEYKSIWEAMLGFGN